MILKTRYESEELRVMRLLDARMDFGENEKLHYSYLKKGFDGERAFDQLLNKMEIGSLILNDLLLEVNHTLFHIDSLVIAQEKIFLFEVKNYEGDYYYHGDRFKTVADNEVKDPILQLRRSETLLRQLLKNLGSNTSLESYIIFINPEFALLQAPRNQQIILPNQLNRFFNKLNKTQSIINSRNTKLADKLMSLHIPHNSYSRLPQYEYSQLQKGILCISCNSVNDHYKEKKFICNQCGCQEDDIEKVILRNVEEFRLLFPERKITTKSIFDWCNGVVPITRIRMILKKNFRLIGFGQWSYYD